LGPPQILRRQIRFFQELGFLTAAGTAANFMMSGPLFPEIGIFGSSWDCCKFCGEIKKDFHFLEEMQAAGKAGKRRRRQNFQFMEARTQHKLCIFLKFLLYYI
jgi:hypothetical protein